MISRSTLVELGRPCFPKKHQQKPWNGYGRLFLHQRVNCKYILLWVFTFSFYWFVYNLLFCLEAE